MSTFQLTDGAAFANKIKRTVDEIFADTNLVYIKAYIDGTEILTNSNFVVHLHQQIGEHDTFEIECSSTAFEVFGAYPFSESRNFLGKKIIRKKIYQMLIKSILSMKLRVGPMVVLMVLLVVKKRLLY